MQITSVERLDDIEAVLQHAPVIVWAVDRHGVLRRSVGGGLAHYRIDPHEFEGVDLRRRFAGRPELVAVIDRTLAGETFTADVRVYGHDLRVSFHPTFDDDGNVSGGIGVASVVTEQRRTAAELERALARTEALAELSRSGAEAVDDLDRVLEIVVDTAGRLVGDSVVLRLETDGGALRAEAAYSPDPRVRRDILTVFRTWDQPAGTGLAAAVMATGQPVRIPVVDPALVREMVHEGYHRYLDRFPFCSILDVPLRVRGRTIGVLGMARHATGRPYTDEDEDFVLALADRAALAIDNVRLLDSARREVVQRRRAEQERRAVEERLRVAQRLESVGQLAGGIAHDFNNLLGVIGTRAELARAQLPAGAPALDPLDEIVATTDRAAALTRQLLLFSRGEPAPVETVDVDAVIGDLLDLLDHTLGARVRVTASLRSGASARIDAVQLEQVVINLALNARDAMPDGGELVVETDVVDLDAEFGPLHGALTPGRHVRLRVSDTGVGMPPEVVARACEPFFTTKPREAGTGLGLATVYGIVTQAGGEVALYSEPGLGTTARILLPAFR